MRTPYTSKWKLFEKLVAAIHLIHEPDSRVKWNDKINGRQFDVSIRTRKGFYDYLTVIECKNASQPVPVKDVEAFVTKSEDINADKAILVSSYGFQSGAEGVAKRHGIELFTLKAIAEIPAEIDTKEITYGLSIYDVKLHPSDGKPPILLPEERNMLPYLIKKTILKKAGMITSLESILESLRPQLSDKARDKAQDLRVDLQPGTIAVIPTIEKEQYVSAMSFKYERIPVKIIKSGGYLDPQVMEHVYTQFYYENALTNEQFVIPMKDVKIGFDTRLEAGKFYETPALEFSYYCENIESEVATIFMVESYQHGELIQTRFRQKLEHAKHFIEVTDEREIARLRKLYEQTINQK